MFNPVAVMLCMVCFAPQVFAQNEAQNPAPGTLGSALAIEDPTARIAALQKFIRTNNLTDQAQTAREAIVASWAQLAEVQLGENNIEKAAAEFRKAILALPDKITDRFFEETVIRIPMAASVRGYRNEAIVLARQLEKRFAREPVRLVAIGEFFLNNETPSDAIRAIEAAIKLGADEARFHRVLGAAYRMGLRLDDAVAEYQQATKIDPNEKRAYYELANMYRAHGAYEDAVKLYRRQVEIDPKHMPSFKGLALSYLAQGNESESAAALNQVRDLRGASDEITNDIYLQTQMAFYYLAQRKWQPARQAAEAALIVEPRYAWARIAAAEVDLAENKFFDAERNLIAALRYANFPTLYFTLGKVYLAAEDFDGALEQFAKAFSFSPQKGFTTKLGGVLDLQADNLKELLLREHQAALFLAEPPTDDEQFKIAESLVRFDLILRAVKSATARRAARGESKTEDAANKQIEDLKQAAIDFTEAEKTRRSFRALHIAQKLAQAGVASGTAVELADLALGLAEIATELDGSVRDYPNFDRDGRLRIFRGRAYDSKGWALFKSGQNQESILALTEAVRAYGPLPEGKRALRHLATVKETVGELPEALDLYIAGYEPPETPSAVDVNRAVIEVLYRKVKGSLDGLDQRLGRTAGSTGADASVALAAASARAKPETMLETPAPANQIVTGEVARKPSPAEEKIHPFKLSIPAFSSGKEPGPSPSSSLKLNQPSSEAPPVLPRTDPMFARPSDPKLHEIKAPETRTDQAPAAPPVVEPAPKTPLTLPEISSELAGSIQLIQFLDPRELLAPRESFTIVTELEMPPAPPQTETFTRKRRVTPEGEVVVTRPRQVGQAGTRRRRVTNQ